MSLKNILEKIKVFLVFAVMHFVSLKLHSTKNSSGITSLVCIGST